MFEVLLIHWLRGTVGDFLGVCLTERLNVPAELIHLLLAHLLHLFLHFELVCPHFELEVDLAHASIQLVNLSEKALLTTSRFLNFLL